MIAKEIKNSHQAFSLIELLIVVFLISLIYFFIFANVNVQNKKKEETLSPLTLGEVSKKLIGTEGEFFCLAKCTECYYSLTSSVDIHPYKGTLDFGKDVKIYQLDSGDNFEEKEFGRINDEKVCLRFNLYNNQSSTKLVIQNDQGTFYLPSYFGEPQKVSSLEEAKKLWLKYNPIISSGGDFY